MAGKLHNTGAMAMYVVTRSGLAAGNVVVPHESRVTVDTPEPESCESLFWALDGRDLVVLGKRWHVEVFSVVELAGRRYLQLSLNGITHYMLTLRVAPDAPVRRLIPAVLTWLTHPTASGEVIDVV
jgi:hypothetical protein